MPLIGKTILNYTISQKIGEGGMGSVYMGLHNTFNTKVAIKVLHPALRLNDILKEKFKKEAKVLSTLNHPNIVKVIDYYEDEEYLFIIMEYIDGLPLDELIKTKTGLLPEKRALQLFSKILDGIAYAHGKGIVHRDIKPSNIIIKNNDDIVIIDFGIVKIMDVNDTGHTSTGTKIGTLRYMSPEQVLGKNVDAQSDIYSLGVLLFYMVTGKSAYAENASEYELMKAVIELPLPKANTYYPSLTKKTQAVISEATNKNKIDRYVNCINFKKSVELVLLSIENEKAKNLPELEIRKPKPPKNAKSIEYFESAKIDYDRINENAKKRSEDLRYTQKKGKEALIPFFIILFIVVIILIPFAINYIKDNDFEKSKIITEKVDTRVGGAIMVESRNWIQNLSGSADHTTFIALLSAANLVGPLSGVGPFTIFAPTNVAFSKLPLGTVDALLKPENKSKLTGILCYHIIAGALKTSELKYNEKLKTMQGEELLIYFKKNKIFVNGADIEIENVINSNGIIHSIDRVLLPRK